MKSFLFILELMISVITGATPYYVKSGGGTGPGLSDGTAWSPAYLIVKLPTLNSNDEIFLKRGDQFPLKLVIENSNLKFKAYGTGDKPVITAMASLTSWTLSSTPGVYYATLDVPFKLNVVKLDGKLQPMGRYPNSDYLHHTSHSGNSSISGTDVSDLPFNPAGGQVVIRKARFIIDRHPIISRSGSTLNYSAGNEYGNNSQYEPLDGNGFFIQHHLGALDLLGDWMYDSTLNRLYMFFGISTPTFHQVEASVYDKNVQLNSQTGARFNDIVFEGGNNFGAWNIGSSNIQYTNCDFINQGGDAIWASGVHDLTITGGSIRTALNNGIYFVEDMNDCNVEGMYIWDAGLIAGAGLSGDGAQNGILMSGTDLKVSFCNIDRVGYNGISFAGDELIVSNNTIDSFCMTKDDGGGIYTYNSGGARSGRVVDGNVITNAVGAFSGAEGYYYSAFGNAAGIYLDEHSDHTIVQNNTVTAGPWFGIFLNNVEDNNEILRNTVSGYPEQFHITSFTANKTRGTIVSQNNFIALSGQLAVALYFYNSETPQDIAYFYRNRYNSNSSQLFKLSYQAGDYTELMNLISWKYARFAQDGTLVQIPFKAGKVALSKGRKFLTHKY